MKRLTSIRRPAVQLLTVLLVALAGAVAFAAPASAHCGTHPHQDLDSTVGSFIATGVNIRTGPHLGCTPVGQGQPGQAAAYHCWSPGDVDPASGVASWTFVTRGSTSGWVNDNYLSGFGSFVRCPGT